MQISGWKYYNHAAVPTCAPHEDPNTRVIETGEIWSLSDELLPNKHPMMVWWTTDFDCSQETPYWYVIKEGPFSLDELSKKYRHNVKVALDRCEVKWVNAIECEDELWEVYEAAYTKYEGAQNKQSRDDFHKSLLDRDYEWCVAYSRENGNAIGWMKCLDKGECVETQIAKYHPGYLSLRASDAIHYHVLNRYLNELGRKYVTSGTRNLNHKTHVQDYKIHNWHFRQAYCRLHLMYSPKVAWIIWLLYPIRKCLILLDSIKKVHAINGLLLMEEVSRKCKH